MPELPEVEVVRRGLARWVSGRTVAAAEVLHPRAVRRQAAGGADFAARLGGVTLGEARRRGNTSGCRSRTAPSGCSATSG